MTKPTPPPPPAYSGFRTDVTLEDLRVRLADFANDRDWNQYHTPRNLLLAMVGEVGELSEIFQWRGDAGCAPGLPGWKSADREHLGEEMSDVLLYLLRLADRCEVDLGRAVLRKLRKNAEKYPAAKVRGSSRKYTEYAADNEEADAAAAEGRAEKRAKTDETDAERR
jgi:dCTP diphosphatase